MKACQEPSPDIVGTKAKEENRDDFLRTANPPKAGADGKEDLSSLTES